MPNNDGTGPFGDGRPGKGLGHCGKFAVTMRGGQGRGFGNRCGRGAGIRNRGGMVGNRRNLAFQENPELYTYSRDNLLAQKAELEDQLKWLNGQLENQKEDSI